MANIFDQYTPSQRKQFYSNMGPSDYKNLVGAGVSNRDIVQDYNSIMGTNYSPLAGAQYAGGFSDQDVFNWMNTASPNEIEQTAKKWGLGAEDLAQGWNRVADENVTPYQAAQYTGLPYDQGNFLSNMPGDIQGPYTKSSGSQSSNSFSGIDWDRPVASSLLEQITQTAGGLQNKAQQLPDEIQKYYRELMQNALGPDAFQGTLNQLAGRGVLDSSVTSDAMSKAASNVMEDVGERAYQSGIEGLKAELDVPRILSQIAGIDKIRRTQSSGSQSSVSKNPLAKYQLMWDITRGT
jgi:hypothetical protein